MHEALESVSIWVAIAEPTRADAPPLTCGFVEDR
jgi:hypothetical protein